MWGATLSGKSEMQSTFLSGQEEEQPQDQERKGRCHGPLVLLNRIPDSGNS
jgi:hypothetical protein